jgi:hypothetical protein
MSSKYQIFVSSTYVDLKDPRDLVIKAILEMGHIPVGMEMFSAADEEQWNIIQRQIDQSDYYVLIMANRYGSVTQENISYTEKEYDYARSQGIPCLAFVLESSALWPANHTDIDPDQVLALGLFKDKVKQRPVSFWKNTEDLYGKCSIALMKAFSAYPREGWIRASQFVDNKTTAELTRLSSENAHLREELIKSKTLTDEKRSKEDREYIKILRANKRELHVRKTDSMSFELIKESTLFAIFRALAPEMMVEISVDEMAHHIAVVLCNFDGDVISAAYPMPSNMTREWMADFAALGLVTPSNKKKPMSDKNEYWSLTEKGKECMTYIRRVVLQGALREQLTNDSEAKAQAQAEEV